MHTNYEQRLVSGLCLELIPSHGDVSEHEKLGDRCNYLSGYERKCLLSAIPRLRTCLCTLCYLGHYVVQEVLLVGGISGRGLRALKRGTPCEAYTKHGPCRVLM
jgi:hypothetical protein